MLHCRSAVQHPILLKKTNNRHPERSEGSAGYQIFNLSLVVIGTGEARLIYLII